jgi:DNA-binding transcriptional ArsR family regulator
MVMNKEQLDRVFSALADSTRRGMLAQLAQGEVNISHLAQQYDMSQPAISKHLKVLDRAGLIQKKKNGREYLIRVNPKPMEEAQSWIGYYAKFWQTQFNAVEDYLNMNEK